MQPKFFILSLPRSRSKWLSEWLGAALGRRVGHDLITECDSIAEFQRRMGGLRGTCETGAVVGWKVLRELWPEAKFVAVRRDPQEVIGSFQRLGFFPDPLQIYARANMLEAFAQSPGVRVVEFEDLGSWGRAKALFEFLSDGGFDGDLWKEFDQRNIQVDFPRRVAELESRRAGMSKLYTEVATRAALAQGGVACRNLN